MADASHPQVERQQDDVNQVLEEIGAGKLPQLLVFNKTDLLPPENRPQGIMRNAAGMPVAVYLSVKEGWGLEDLRLAMAELALAQAGLSEKH